MGFKKSVCLFIVLSFIVSPAFAKKPTSVNKLQDGYRGIVIIVSAPSGTGKTTAMNAVMKQESGIKKIISVTTRGARPGEEDGLDYRFISKKEYQNHKKHHDFVQMAENYGNFYGVLRKDVENIVGAGHDAIIDVNYAGMQELSRALSSSVDVVTIYLLPPSVLELKNRLVNRKTDSMEIIEGRMRGVYGALENWDRYQYIIPANGIEGVSEKILSIYRHHAKMRAAKMAGYKLFEQLQQEKSTVLGK